MTYVMNRIILAAVCQKKKALWKFENFHFLSLNFPGARQGK